MLRGLLVFTFIATTQALLHVTPSQERDAVAVLTSGTSARYLLHNAVESFIGPMVSEGYRVDYYVALNMQAFDSFKKAADHFLPGRVFDQSRPAVAASINSTVSGVGGTLQSLRMEDAVELDTSDKSDIEASRWYPFNTPNERSAALSNWIKKSKLLEVLWSDVEKAEEEFGRYKTVIIIDDDACWVEPFSLKKVLKRKLELRSDKYVVTLQCGKGSSYATRDGELCDYMQILGREAAPIFAKQRSSMQHYRDEHNGEALMWKLAQNNDLETYGVSARDIPMQRCGRTAYELIGAGKANNMYTTGDGPMCIHKLCVSEDAVPISELPKCDSISS